MGEEWNYVCLRVLVVCVFFLSVCVDSSGVKHYTNKWLVHVPLGEVVAREVARSNDMQYQGPDYDNDGFHVMAKDDLPLKSFDHNEDITNRLNSHSLVTTAIQEAVKARSYRGAVYPRHVVPKSTTTSSKTSNSVRRSHMSYFKKEKMISNYINAFNDLRWPDMWYFQDYRTSENQPVVDMNIVPVFFELKITGQGVNITVPDDGIQWSHPEILPSFKQELSWNYILNNKNITPSTDDNGDIKAHGTRCAGEIIMQANNKICGVGAAYGANIGGIKFLDETSTDAREAKVLKYALEYVCIYSNSWGPADTGTIMEHLSDLIKMSFTKGIHQGRDGKGVIYVFAAGNGKADGDNCACDGFVNSIYTIVIASCDDSGHVTHYSERCASIIATAYSGAGFEKNVLTTDVNGQCTDKHTGTSAAAPLVSGIIALALSANPELTWRDVQYLLVWTSQVVPLSDNFGWNRNKAGFYYSVDFGFGLVNAYKLVKEAQTWQNVPEMSSCGIRMPKVRGFPISRSRAVRITVNSTGCEGLSGEINYIEFVQLVLSMTYPKRGDIQIAIRSPLGTECRVLDSRPKDFNTRGLNRWTFTILAFWGESPKGNFIIDVFDTTGKSSNTGVILEMTLSIHGTKDIPPIYKNGPRPYDEFKLAKPGDKPRFLHLGSMTKAKNVDVLRNDDQRQQIIRDAAHNYDGVHMSDYKESNKQNTQKVNSGMTQKTKKKRLKTDLLKMELDDLLNREVSILPMNPLVHDVAINPVVDNDLLSSEEDPAVV